MIGTKDVVKTYCSGKRLWCEGGIACSFCDGSGEHAHSLGTVTTTDKKQIGLVNSFTNTELNLRVCGACGFGVVWGIPAHTREEPWWDGDWFFATPECVAQLLAPGSSLYIDPSYRGRVNHFYCSTRHTTLDQAMDCLGSTAVNDFAGSGCLYCGGSGRMPCEHQGKGEAHFFCSHTADDANHKWHYTRAE